MDKPKIKQFTVSSLEGSSDLLLTIGKDAFSLSTLSDLGERELILKLLDSFKGNLTFPEISDILEIEESSVREFYNQLVDLGLNSGMESVTNLIPKETFSKKLYESIEMWKDHLGFHPLFRRLKKKEVRKEVFLGLLIETYHFVKSASKHVSNAIVHCSCQHTKDKLSEYLFEEYSHYQLFIQSLTSLGFDFNELEKSNPLVGTQALINYLLQIGKVSSTAYLCCINFLEIEKPDVEKSKNALLNIAKNYDITSNNLKAIISHSEEDADCEHSKLFDTFFSKDFINIDDANFAINSIHDLKHTFDLFHDNILEQYSKESNRILNLPILFSNL